jgi:hypothetical protein
MMMMLGNSERAGLVQFLSGRLDHCEGLRPGRPTTTLGYAPIGLRDLGRASTLASQTLTSEPLRGAGSLLDLTVPHYSQVNFHNATTNAFALTATTSVLFIA